MKKEFWKDWKNKTKIEKNAIKSLLAGKKLILDKIPKKEINSIYALGSFPRREMNKKSDVDIMVVLKNSKLLKNVEGLNNEFGKKFSPELNICAYSLWELKNGRRCKSILPKGKPHPLQVSYLLPGYKLIYGNSVKLNILKRRTPKGDLEGMAKGFEEVLFPWYKKGFIDFGFLVKSAFWLVFCEQQLLGKNPPHSWKELDKSIKEKNHIVHDTLRLRLYPTKDKKIRAKYISKLKRYLDKLERKYEIQKI